MSKDSRYWDSVSFLGWLSEEPDKQQLCESVIRAAEDGKVLIVTSAITLIEVIKLKNHSSLGREKENLIKDFFKQDYIIVRNVDPFTAEEARELVWSYPHLKPKDSIHLATAIRMSIPILDTFDDDLIKLDGKIGSPPIRIGKPNLPMQETLSLEDDEETSD